jgi:hypothetical protein
MLIFLVAEHVTQDQRLVAQYQSSFNTMGSVWPDNKRQSLIHLSSSCPPKRKSPHKRVSVITPRRFYCRLILTHAYKKPHSIGFSPSKQERRPGYINESMR